jgi:hypothetical protein
MRGTGAEKPSEDTVAKHGEDIRVAHPGVEKPSEDTVVEKPSEVVCVKKLAQLIVSFII